MKSKVILASPLVGLVCGLISTYPVQLGPVPSFILWAVAGIIVGLFAQEKKVIVWSGVLYGIFLSVFFLFSRFGGTPDKIVGYSLFVAALSIAGALGGILTVFVGSFIRSKLKHKKGDDNKK